MQDNMMQPFMKLAQANMELLTEFSLWPETVSQVAVSPQAFVQQAQHAAMSLLQPGAFAQLAQGMMKNYSEFLAEWGQTAMATFAQGQSAMIARAQEVTAEGVDAAEARGRRSLSRRASVYAPPRSIGTSTDSGGRSVLLWAQRIADEMLLHGELDAFP